MKRAQRIAGVPSKGRNMQKMLVDEELNDTYGISSMQICYLAHCTRWTFSFLHCRLLMLLALSFESTFSDAKVE